MKFRHRPIATLIISVFLLCLQVTEAAPRHRADSRASKRKSSTNKPPRGPAKAERAHSVSKAARSKAIRGGERRRIEAQRRAEVARLAALARQRAAEDVLRERVQALIINDDLSGEDPEIRRVAVNALGNHAGTVVVMNPRTGQIYSIVNQQWGLREGFKPCSTIKLVTGLAGLNERVIDNQDTKAISDNNQVTLTSALAHSKNEYFQTVGGRVGFGKMITYARQLGLGEKTGINARNETAGRVPHSKTGYAVNHMSSHGDDFKVTALQLATLVSAMSNGGKLLRPFVAHEQNPTTKPKIRRIVAINSEAFRSMLPGMVGAVSYGSGRKAFDPRETIAGKTGTCIEHGSWIGLFTSYAPVADPQLAVVVIAKGSDGRNHFPAAVAGRIYRDLNSRFSLPNQSLASGTRSPTPSQTSPSISDTDIESDSDADDSDQENDAATTNKTTQPARIVLGDQRPRVYGKVKATVMVLPSANIKKPNSSPRN
jgi:penicillin-binding protein 2